METATQDATVAPSEQVSGNTQAGIEGQATGTETTQTESFSSVDPSTLAPELQGIYKSMQADYTKKTQGLSDASRKAAAYDEMMGNPNLTKFMETVSNPTVEPETPMTGVDLLNKIIENPDTLTEMIRSEAEKVAAEKYGHVAEDVAQQKAERIVSDLAKKYPDYLDFEDSMVELIKNNDKMDLETAYKIASYDKVKQKGVDEGAKAVVDRNKTAQPTGTSAPVNANKEAKTMQEAFAKAKEQLNWQG